MGTSISYVLAGSYAFDTVLLHRGHFHTRILPEKVARLNVAFGADTVQDEFGGCAGNIAYNARLLQDSPVLLGNVGRDFGPYKSRLNALGLNTEFLVEHEDTITAHAWLLTDTENNQIISFHDGAQARPLHLPSEVKLAWPTLIWHIAPEFANNMVFMANTAREWKRRYTFDPGQVLPTLLEQDQEGLIDLRTVLRQAAGLFVNDYEAELLLEHTGNTSLFALVPENGFLVRTLGAKGAEVLDPKMRFYQPAATPREVVDPTGCGDALRAGFLHAWLTTGCVQEGLRLGTVMASFAVECSGGQNHAPAPQAIQQRLAALY